MRRCHRRPLFASVAWALFGAGCALETGPTSVATHPNPTEMTSTTTTEAFGLPPIDRRAPAHLETATFALG